MKITFLTPSDNLTGGTRVIATYARLLQQRGHTVTVVSNAPDQPTLRQRWQALRRGRWLPAVLPSTGHIALSGVTHRTLDRPRAIVSADVPDADVVVATWWETAVWMHALPPSKGRHVHLIQGHEVWTGGDVRERVHAALRLPGRKIAISQALAREIQAELGDLHIDVVPNAVDLDLFNAPARERGSPPTVGFIYARSPIKGSDLCARACELARLQLKDLRVLAFGIDTPSTDWPLPAGTEFIRCPDQALLPSLYARCDAWLFGSRLDSFGLPILEAMACRTPVIGVPVGAAPQLLGDGCGVLLPDASPQAMADALVRLCGGLPADWARLSASAHERAHRYSWDDAATHLLSLLHEPAPAPAPTPAPSTAAARSSALASLA
jgi:glycosyltransferase involved in cell wall biosynthesis